MDGDFMSRNHVDKGFISLHPGGTHGPHPGATERSIGQTETLELAVMVDTFRPLQVTQAAVDMSDPDYLTSVGGLIGLPSTTPESWLQTILPSTG